MSAARDWETADLLAERRPEGEPALFTVEDSLENLLQLPLDQLLSSRTRQLPPLDPLEIPVTPTLPSAPLTIATPSPTMRSNLPKLAKSPTQKLDSNSQPISTSPNGHRRAASASMKPSTSLPTKLASYATPPIPSPTLPKAAARTKSPRPSNGFNTIPLPSPTARKLNPAIQLNDFRAGSPGNGSPRSRTLTGNLNSPKLSSSISGKPSTKFNMNARPSRPRSFSSPRLDSDSMSSPNPPWSTEEPLVYRIMGDENDPFGQKSRAAEREMGSDGRWEDRVIPTIARKIQADRLAKLEGERLINSWDIDGNPISTLPANRSPRPILTTTHSSTAPTPIEKSPTDEYPPASTPTDPQSRTNYSYPTLPPPSQSSDLPTQIKNQNHVPPVDFDEMPRKELWESNGGPISRFDTTDHERRDEDGHDGGCCKCNVM